MIRIGFGETAKKKTVKEYLAAHENINKIYCFYFKEFPIEFNVNVEVEYIEFSETIMYRTFYPLLEKIDKNSLIVINECMRTKTRSDLHYNCIHHYINQSGGTIIFEYFPIVDSKDDFMILMDFENKGKYKGKPFEYFYLQDEDIMMKPRKVKLLADVIETDEKQKVAYETEKEKLFDSLGNKDPDTVPRNLQLFTGNFKKSVLKDGEMYIARNKRFKLPNVTAYTEAQARTNYTVIDFHHRRINFNDFLKKTGMATIKYLATDLTIDTILMNEFMEWKARLEAIYDKANLC